MDGVNWFDSAVMGFIQENFHNPAADAVFPVITYLGEYGVFWIAVSLILLCMKKTRRCGFCMLCAMAGGFLTGEILIKNLVCRPRPFHLFSTYTALLIPQPSGYSFPSGHSCSSFAAAVSLAFFSKKWGVPALILAALIAFSRIFLFVHWPTDVLAGVALGTAFAFLTVFVYRRYALPRLEAPKDR